MPLPALRVLVVDPDEDTRRISTLVFQHLGHRAMAVATGTEGLRLAVMHRPDAIVSELGVPPLGGERLLASLRADARTRQIPVIAHTARASLKDRDWLMACGFDDVVLKPCEPRALAVIVEHVVARCDGDAMLPDPSGYSTPLRLRYSAGEALLP
jgi:CheY-like chemotaxis protein